MEKAIRLKRLHFRSMHRGSKETDLVLGAYVTSKLVTLSDAEIDELELFLEENDNDIWDWVSGKSLPEDGKYAALIADLRKNYDLPALSG